MPEMINTKDQFIAALREALPDLIKEHPQLVLDALSRNSDALRQSLATAGFIVAERDGQGALLDTDRMVRSLYREATQDGRIVRGMGARDREAMSSFARQVREPGTGRMVTRYVHGDIEKLAGRWFSAFFSGDKRDPESGDDIRSIYAKLQEATRAPSLSMTAEAGTGGSFLVPTVIVAQIYEEMQERYVLPNLVSVFRSATPLQINRRIGLPTVRRGAPATDATEQDMAKNLGYVSLSPEKVDALAYVEVQLAAAAAVGPVQWIIGQFAEAFARDNQRVIVAGQAGLKEPRGLTTLPTNSANAYDNAKTASWTDTDNQTRRDSIRKALYAVKQLHRERPSFAWITNNDGVQKMASLNDTNQAPFRDGPPPTYSGKQIVETEAIVTDTTPNPDTTTLIGSDMEQYAWLESPTGLRVKQTDIGGEAWASDTIGVLMIQHVDGAPVIPPATVLMTNMAI